MSNEEFEICKNWLSRIKEKVYESLSIQTIQYLNEKFKTRIDLAEFVDYLRNRYKNERKEEFKSVLQFEFSGSGDCEDQLIYFLVMIRLGKVRGFPVTNLNFSDIAFCQYSQKKNWHVGLLFNEDNHAKKFIDFLPARMSSGRIRFCFPVSEILST